MKFIILLHKIAYNYVTLFNVYECAISPPLLEERIADAEEIVMGRHFVAIAPKVYGEQAEAVAHLGFTHDAKENLYLAPATPELRETLKSRGVAHEARLILDRSYATDPDRLDSSMPSSAGSTTTGSASSRS